MQRTKITPSVSGGLTLQEADMERTCWMAADQRASIEATAEAE
jgi:hypothetical protein